MLSFKVILLLGLTAPCVFAASCLQSETKADNTGSLAAKVKINWGPVWDDIEGNNEFINKNRNQDDNQEGSQNCDAPNGLGLKYFIDEAVKMLPKEKMIDIYKSYIKNDTEVKAVNDFLQSPQTIEKITAIEDSQDYQTFKDYCCGILHIELPESDDILIPFNPLLNRDDSETQEGIRGLINAISDVVPYQQIRDLYQSLLASDEELSQAVAHIKSEEFHQLLLNVKNNVPEYQTLRKELEDLGVPVEEIRNLLASILGWSMRLQDFV